jgi:hypothetical protein
MNNRNYIEVFKLVEVSNMGYSQDDLQSTDPRMEHALKKYKDVFRSELLSGIPLKRSVDHSIETGQGAKLPHRPLYQLSPAELHESKEYVVDLMYKGKILQGKFPYEASLIFVKDGNKPLREVVDYRKRAQQNKKKELCSFTQI